MKRFFAFLLVCAMILGLVPTVFATEGQADAAPLTPEDYITADLMWDAVNAKEEELQAKKATIHQTVEAVIAVVTQSPYYAEDTLIRNGDHLFWETVDGIPCGYSPRLAELGNHATPLPGYDIASAETTVTTSYEKKSGVPGSKDVFLIQPYYGIDDNFTEQYVTEVHQIAQATGGAATIYRTMDATVDNIADALAAGAVVVFDSHGDTDYANGEDCTSKANSSYICLQTNVGLTADDYEPAVGEFGEYYHAFYGGSYGSMRYYCVDGTVISNHMDKDADSSMLWMAICLSMATDGIHAPLMKRGVEVAYGYSQSVTFEYDYKWEEVFWKEMRLGKTVAESISTMKQKVGLWDWCHASAYDTIEEARSTYSAFPIVVSLQDKYPGHGNVDDLQNVNSSWVLIAPCEHSNITTVPPVAVTCTTDGHIGYYVCNDCNAVFLDEALTNRVTMDSTLIPATGHSYDEGVITTPPGCTNDGVMTYTCINCGNSYTEQLLALGHQYIDNICSNCGKEKPVVSEFAYGESGVYILAALVNGTYYAMCNDFTDMSGKLRAIEIQVTDGFVEKEFAKDYAIELTYIPAKDMYTIHNGSYFLRYPSSTNLGGITSPYYWSVEKGLNGSWRFTSQTSNRVLAYRASGFNVFGCYYTPSVTAGSREYFDIEIIPVAGAEPEGNVCQHLNTQQSMVPPTCTEEGKLTFTCGDCGEVLNFQPLPPTGHTWIEGEIQFNPMCEIEGKQIYTCQFCNATKIESLPALGHTWDKGNVTQEPTCTSIGQIKFTCIYCTKTKVEDLPEKDHAWDEGVLTAEPTCSEEGTITYTCTLCNGTKTEAVPTVPHSFHNGMCTVCGASFVPEGGAGSFTQSMSGTYVLAANVNGTYYAMSNSFPVNGKLNSSVVTPINGYITEADALGLAIELVYDEDTDNYFIFNGSSYLSYNDDTNTGASDTPYNWILEEGINGTWRLLAENADRALLFREEYGVFGAYATSNVYNGSTNYFDLEILPVYSYTPGDDIPEWIPQEDERIVINHSLNLASDISINYAILSSYLEEYESFELHCQIPIYNDDETISYRTQVIEGVKTDYFYYFTLTGITAIQMGDSIEATLYMTKDGNEYFSRTDVYSVSDYAYGQLAKESASEALKKLCVELLRYGAYAQQFKGYRTDAPVDRFLTEEQKGYFTDLETVTFNQHNRVLDDLADPTVTWAGKTLNLESKVILKFVANLSNYEGDPEDLSLKLSYRNYKGETVEMVIPHGQMYVEELNYYAFDLGSLLAAELRTVVRAAVYCGDTQVSPTVEYSADAYAVGKTGILLELCKALMSYSDTALAYFTEQ